MMVYMSSSFTTAAFITHPNETNIAETPVTITIVMGADPATDSVRMLTASGDDYQQLPGDRVDIGGIKGIDLDATISAGRMVPIGEVEVPRIAAWLRERGYSIVEC